MVILIIQLQLFFSKKSAILFFCGSAYVAQSGISLYHSVEEEEKPFWNHCVETDNIKS